MLDKSICHFRGLRSISVAFILFLMANSINVASDLGLQCLPITLTQVARYRWMDDLQFYILFNSISVI